MRVVHGNSGLQKTRPNIVAILSNINMMAEENLSKDLHITFLIIYDATRGTLQLFPSNISQCSVRKIEKEEI